MLEALIVAVVAVIAVFFILKAWYRSFAHGRDHECVCGGQCSTRGGACCQGIDSARSNDCKISAPGLCNQGEASSFFARAETAGTSHRSSACSLVSMDAGSRGTVLALSGSGEFQAKLVSMGFNVGSEVTVLKSGAGGSGLLVATGDTRLAIGNAIAERIIVAVDSMD